MDIPELIRQSRFYRIATTARRWAAESTIVLILTDERVQKSVLTAILLLSLVSVFVMDANAAVKFLSFALLFVLTAIVTWSITDPRPD